MVGYWNWVVGYYIIGEIKTGILFKDFYICTTYRKRQKFELISYCFFDPQTNSWVISGQKYILCSKVAWYAQCSKPKKMQFIYSLYKLYGTGCELAHFFVRVRTSASYMVEVWPCRLQFKQKNCHWKYHSSRKCFQIYRQNLPQISWPGLDRVGFSIHHLFIIFPSWFFCANCRVSRRTILEIRQIFMLKAKNAKTGAASNKSWSPEGRQF